MNRSRLFISNGVQAVRLPEAVAFPEDVCEVEILKIGSSCVITPVGKRWDDYFLKGPRLPSDFMDARNQPTPESRERFKN